MRFNMANTYSLNLESSGSDQYSSIDDASQSGLDLSTNFTIEAWVKPESISTRMTIVGKQDVGVDFSYRFTVESDGDILCSFWDASANKTEVATTDTPISAGSWFHIATTVEILQADAGIKFYVNGTEDTNKGTVDNSATTIKNSATPFNVGRNLSSGSGTNYYDGLINNLRIFSDIRTAGEVSSYMRQTLTNTGTANLVDAWYYKNVHTSASGNNDLTASGSPTFSTDIPFSEAGFLAIL
jgi:hypothetical protein